MRAELETQFAGLVATHHAAFERMAQAYEYNPAQRKDLVQEILCSIWTALPSFAGVSTLKNYAFRIAHNVCVAHVARAVRHKTRFVSLEELPEVARDGVADAEHKDQRRKLLLLLWRLKPRDRALALLYLEGFSSFEVAEILGISGANAATSLHRTKQHLANAFKGEQL